jgi:hypothetical protein
MLSFNEFRKNLKEEISVDVLGNFIGGYDLTVHTSPDNNPNQPIGGNFSDRMHYDYCYDTAGNQHNDYRGGHYALP